MSKIDAEITEKNCIFSMNTLEMMERVRRAVKNRDTISEPDSVLSMDLNEKRPYRLYKNGAKQYIDEES
ncbi:hypothetical protein [Ructibacterium gallinarum]|uniref:Uncharacterized protein n=1 Tax=Ructibacterium gallinarum TaxID=2779355 RepID=A0A9D5M4G0_9FIRM|nr:hypothetical protein [Ructibacterium gallinarum]MBE5040529.1 hypothetical protein [Ructibacterium gallinarum]